MCFVPFKNAGAIRVVIVVDISKNMADRLSIFWIIQIIVQKLFDKLFLPGSILFQLAHTPPLIR